MSEPRNSRWRFWGLVFLLGPLPVCVAIAFLMWNLMPNEIARPIPTCAFFGALWGLASGIHSRELSRAMIGLNAGALLGFGAGNILDRGMSGGLGFLEASLVCIIALGVLTGCLRARKPNWISSFCRGVALGIAAMVTMSLLFYLLRETVLGRVGRQLEKPVVLFSAFVASTLGIAILLRGMGTKSEKPESGG